MTNYKKTYKKFKKDYKSLKSKVAAKDIGRAKRLDVINSPLAVKLKARMMFTTERQVLMVNSLDNPGTFIYSLNSPTTPEITSVVGSHKPRGFSEIMAMYDHYTCIQSKVRVDFHNNSTTTPVMAICTLRDNNVESNKTIDYLESTNSQWKLIGTETSGASDKSITLTINPNKFLGRSHPLSDPQLRGSLLTGPEEQCFLHVSGVSIDYFTACSLSAVVSIEYTCIFTEPKQPTQS